MYTLESSGVRIGSGPDVIKQTFTAMHHRAVHSTGRALFCQSGMGNITSKDLRSCCLKLATKHNLDP